MSLIDPFVEFKGLGLVLTVLVLHVEHVHPAQQLQVYNEGRYTSCWEEELICLYIWNTKLFNGLIMNIIKISINYNNNYKK